MPKMEEKKGPDPEQYDHFDNERILSEVFKELNKAGMNVTTIF